MRLVFLIALLPAAAVAECPSAADLSDGIRLTAEGGDSETFSRFDRHTIQSIYTAAAAGYTSRTLIARGLYVTEVVDLENGAPMPDTRLVYDFPVSPEAMPVSPENGKWSADVTVNDMGQMSSEQQFYVFRPMTEITFGRCTYRMVPVDTRFSSEPGYVETTYFLPDLGLSYLAAITDPDGTQLYPYTSIEALD